MPSRDPTTGKRLSGGAQQKLKRERGGDTATATIATTAATTTALAKRTSAPAVVAQLPIPTALADVTAPPTGVVAGVEAWAAGLNLRCAVGLETADELEAVRLVAVAAIVKEIGRLKDKAARAEKALQLRRLRLGGSDEIDLSSPPYHDAVAIVLFAYHKLAALAFEAATSPAWEPDGRVVAVKALASCGFLPCNAELQKIADAVKAA